MSPAVAQLAPVVEGLRKHDPTLTIWTNHDGTVVSNGSVFLDLLVGQDRKSVV